VRRALFLLLALFVAAPSFAAEQKPLTKRERKDLIAKLDEKHRQFLIDVEPIIIDTERDTFLRLETAPQRDAFIDDFWRRRDHAQGTTNFAAKDEYEDLVAAGVIDPTKVVRCALQNAASIASLLLTTEALVSEIPEDKKEAAAPGGPGGMGGMY